MISHGWPWRHDARLHAPKATVQPLLINNTADNRGISHNG